MTWKRYNGEPAAPTPTPVIAPGAHRILTAAVDLTTIHGAITQQQVADAAGCAKGLVTHYFGSMDALRDAVMQEAVERPVLSIVARGLAAGSPIALAAPAAVRSAAIAHLGGDL